MFRICVFAHHFIYIYIILLNLIHFHAFCQFNSVICVFNLFLYFCSKTIWFFLLFISQNIRKNIHGNGGKMKKKKNTHSLMCNHKKQHTTGWRCKRSVSPGKGCIYDYDVIINMSPKCKTKLALIINITKKKL